MSDKFPTTVWITPDPDGVHCGNCKGRAWTDFRLVCNPFSLGKEQYVELFHDKQGSIRCQACLEAERAWKESQAKEKI